MTEKIKYFRHKLMTGTVYAQNQGEEAVVKSVHNGKIFIKFKGKAEHEIEHDAEIVHETFLLAEEITKEEYEAY